MITFFTLNTSNKVLKIINNCIEEMIENALILSPLTEDSNDKEKFEFLEAFFPLHLCRENLNKCINVINDLLEWSRDNYLHDLTCVHEYALFRIFKSFFNEKEDYELTRKKGEKNIYKFQIKNIENYEPEEIYILKKINNRSFYEEELFSDWDFLALDDIVNLYQTDINVFNSLGINLRYYLDLMPVDIKQKIQASLDSKNKQEESEAFIITQINNVIKQMELDPVRLEKYTENEINDDIKNRMQFALELKNIIIERESRGGFAKKEIGEMDFFLYKNYNHAYIQLALGESKVWGKFESQIKQLLGYSNKNINFGFTITINKINTYQEIRDSQIEILNNFECNNLFSIIDIQKKENMLISIHSIPEQNTYFKIYHFILNVNGKYRKEIAVQARTTKLKSTTQNNQIDLLQLKNNIIEKLNSSVSFDDMIKILKDINLFTNDEYLLEIINKFKKICLPKYRRSPLIINNTKYNNIHVYSTEDTPIMGFYRTLKKIKFCSTIKIYTSEIINRYKALTTTNINVPNKEEITEAISYANKKYNFLDLFKNLKLDIYLADKGFQDLRSYLYPEFLDNIFEIYIYSGKDAVYTTLYQLGSIVCLILCDTDEIVPKNFIKTAKKAHLDILNASKADRAIVFSETFAMTSLHNTPFKHFVPSFIKESDISLLENYFNDEIHKKILTNDYCIKNLFFM